MRGKGVSKDNTSLAGEPSSPNNCGRQCLCGTKARLAHKHEMNQRMAEYMKANDETNSSRSGSITTATEEMFRLSVNNNQNKDVDELVDFIEGKTSGNDKKKIKKERQKQERLDALRKQQEEEKLQLLKEKQAREVIKKEQQRLNIENKNIEITNDNLKAQMSKKQLKKAAQRDKKKEEIATHSDSNQRQTFLHNNIASTLMNPIASSPLNQISQFAENLTTSNILSPLHDLKAELLSLSNPIRSLNDTTSLNDMKAKLNNAITNTSNRIQDTLSTSNIENPNMSTNLELRQSLEQLKAKHQRELELLHLKHKQAIEEEELKAMHRQKEQLFMMKQKRGGLSQFPFRERQMNQTTTEMSNATTNSSLDMSKMNGAPTFKAKKKNQPTVTSQPAKVSNTPTKHAENKIRISRNGYGGVDFATIPAYQEDVLSKSSLNPQPSSIGSKPISSNSKIPASMAQHNSLDENEKCMNGLVKIPINNEHEESMVTIRRVNSQHRSSPTATITQSIKSKDNKKVGDKLLYTIVNGQILKAEDAPNIIPGAKPMPREMLRRS